MKNKLSRSEQFGSRVGIHSLTGFAKGFAELLPPSAKEHEFQRRTLKDQMITLRQEEQRLQSEMRKTATDEDRKRISDSLNVCRGRIGFIRKEIPQCHSRSYAEVFNIIAQIYLNQETLYYLEDMTHAIIRHLQIQGISGSQTQDPGPEKRNDEIKAIIKNANAPNP